MADLQSCPADIEQPGEYQVESVLTPRSFSLETAEEGDEAGEDQDQPSDVPRLSLAKPGMNAIRQQPHCWSGQSIANLSSQEGPCCCLGHNYLLEEEEEIVEPARCDQIVDEMTHPVGPDVRPAETVVSIVC